MLVSGDASPHLRYLELLSPPHDAPSFPLPLCQAFVSSIPLLKLLSGSPGPSMFPDLTILSVPSVHTYLSRHWPLPLSSVSGQHTVLIFLLLAPQGPVLLGHSFRSFSANPMLLERSRLVLVPCSSVSPQVILSATIQTLMCPKCITGDLLSRCTLYNQPFSRLYLDV